METKPKVNIIYKTKKICFIAGHYFPDKCGVSDYTQKLSQKLHNDGIESTILTTYQSAQNSQNSSTVGLVNNWDLIDIFYLAETIPEIEADCLHIQYAPASYRFKRSIFLLPLLLKTFGYRKPIITTLHEYGNWDWYPYFVPQSIVDKVMALGEKNSLWDREGGSLITQSDAVICTNDVSLQTIRNRLPNISSKIYKIPLAPSIDRISCNKKFVRNEIIQRLHWPKNSIILCFFGFIHPVKGLETLLQALKSVQTSYTQVRLLILGGKKSTSLQDKYAQLYFNQINSLIKKLGLEDSVYISGYLSSQTISAYLQAADIGVLPFNHGVNLKSSSLITMLSHQLPVIATKPDLEDETLKKSQAAFLVTPQNPTYLAEAIKRFIHQKGLVKKYAATGKEFSKQFSWDMVINRHSTLYTRLISSQTDIQHLSQSVSFKTIT